MARPRVASEAVKDDTQRSEPRRREHRDAWKAVGALPLQRPQVGLVVEQVDVDGVNDRKSRIPTALEAPARVKEALARPIGARREEALREARVPAQPLRQAAQRAGRVAAQRPGAVEGLPGAAVCGVAAIARGFGPEMPDLDGRKERAPHLRATRARDDQS